MILVILAIILSVMIIEGFALYMVLGNIYGFIRKPPVLIQPKFALKLTINSIFGSVLLLVGGVLLAISTFHTEFKKRPDYRAPAELFAGSVIVVLWFLIMLFSLGGLLSSFAGSLAH